MGNNESLKFSIDSMFLLVSMQRLVSWNIKSLLYHRNFSPRTHLLPHVIESLIIILVYIYILLRESKT